MPRRRGFAMAVCRGCGTAWISRSARYCGHCGAALDVTEAADAGQGRPGARRGRGEARGGDADGGNGSNQRRVVGIVLAAVLLAVVSIAAVTGDSLWEPDPLAEDPAGVELPDPEDIEDGEAEPEPTDPGTSSDGPVGEPAVCEPDDCALWTIPDPPGPFTVVGSILVVLVPGGDPEAPGDEELRLQGFSLFDGQPVWETGLGVPPPGDGRLAPSLHPVDDEHVMVGVGESLALLEVTEGTLQWLADIDHVVGVAGAFSEDRLLAVGQPHREEHADAPGGGSSPGASDQHESDDGVATSRVASSVLDRATGKPVWTAEGRGIVTVVGDHALTVESSHSSVEARDLRTGDLVWGREVQADPRRTLQGIDQERVALFHRGGLLVVDVRDGERLAEIDIDLSGDPHVQFVGDLVVVTDGPPNAVVEPRSHTGKLFDLREPDAEPRRLDGLVQAVPLIPERDLLAPLARPEPTGLAMVFHHEEGFEIRVLDPDGTVRWTFDGALDEPTCCVQIHPTRDDQRMVMAAPSFEIGHPTIVETDDGSPIATIALPDDLEPREPLRLFGDVAVVQDVVGQGLVLAGDAGYVRISDGTPRYLGPPVPVVGGPGGILGIDPKLLFDEGSRREGGWLDGE